VVDIRESEYTDPADEFGETTPTDAETSEDGNAPDGLPDFDVIIGAPDLGVLLTRTPTRRAREYKNRVASLFRVGMISSLNAGNFQDAAAYLWYGPGASTAIGNLADNYNSIAKGLDIITSPSSPVAEVIATLLPLASQLARNHEQALAEVPGRLNMGKAARARRKAERAAQTTGEPPMTLKIWRWKIPVRWKIRSPFGFFGPIVKSQSQEPNLMAARVFTDPTVVRKLAGMGVIITTPNGGKPGA